MAKHEMVTALGRDWLEWLSEYPVGPERIGESVDYLRRGAVGELRIDGGSVEAQVQDLGPAPCRVVLQFTAAAREQWDLAWSLITPEAMREYRKGSPGVALRRALAVAEVNLLPERYREIKTACTCSDWMRPCKHSLAVLRALGEEIERDPMLLVRLRGGGPREQEEVLEAEEGGEPLRTDPGAYWGENRDWDGFEDGLLGGGVAARLLKRLGPVAVYGVRMDPDAMFKPVYEGVASEAKVMIESIRKKIRK
jgi:uncharacterized Zn finger protein